ncbi:MAG: energy-coupling factor transporter transmembrane component T [Christensenellales bacterium]
MLTHRGLNTVHPFVSLLYFMTVMALAMVFLHPLYSTLALTSAFAYTLCLKGKKAALFFLRFPLPLLAVTALVNLLVNNSGETVLFYWPWNKAATLESLLYGLALGVMAVTILLWFYCLSYILNSEKTQYLLSGAAPSAGLMLSMVFHLIPSFEKKAKQIIAGQAGLGKNMQGRSVSEKLKSGTLVLSALTEGALEGAMERADAMRARGYGSPRSSRYSSYIFCARDMVLSVIAAVLFIIIVTGAIQGEGSVTFLPKLTAITFVPLWSPTFWAYAGLCFLPVILILWEEMRWHILQSKI